MIPPLTAQFTTSSGRYRLYTPSIIYYEFRTNTKSEPDINSMGAPAYPVRLRDTLLKCAKVNNEHNTLNIIYYSLDSITDSKYS